jgi:hypothetical protein
MATQQFASSNGATPAVAPAERRVESPVAGADAHVLEPPSLSTAERKVRLAEVLVAKTEQGYEIESQTDTEAVLVTKGRKRWFGMGGNNASTRQITSIDEQGKTRTRTG